MATIIESWQKHLESEAERINGSKELSKDEKAARIHSERAQMVHRSRVTLSDYKSRLAIMTVDAGMTDGQALAVLQQSKAPGKGGYPSLGLLTPRINTR